MPATRPDEANQFMVDRLIAEGALWSRPIIEAFRATPRHAFLDRVFIYQRRARSWREVLLRHPDSEEIDLIYSDRALITHLSPARPGQQGPDRQGPDQPGTAISSSSQPSLMAQMLEDLQPAPGQRVLEIGAGTGYNAALLSHLIGDRQPVHSLDVDRHVLSEAWDHLRKFPDRRVELHHADGRAGLSARAPFDRIMVTAASDDLESAWLEQLAEGGVLLVPLSLAPGLAFIARGSAIAHPSRTVGAPIFRGRLTRAAYFMPLRPIVHRSEGEPGREEEGGSLHITDMEAVPAPWGRWLEQQGHGARLGWTGFIQALAFHAWLLGFAVHYQTLASGETTYGISERPGSKAHEESDTTESAAACWLGACEWQVNQWGQELGQELWRSFLNAGGPWPTEYDITAGPELDPSSLPTSQPVHCTGRRCRMLWQQREPRERLGWM